MTVLVLNVFVSYRIVADQFSDRGQKIGQAFLVWVVPVVGAILVLTLQRDQPERSDGKYPQRREPDDDLEMVAGRALRSGKRRNDREEESSDAQGSGDD